MQVGVKVTVGEPEVKVGVKVSTGVLNGAPGAVGEAVIDLLQPVIVPMRARVKRKITCR